MDALLIAIGINTFATGYAGTALIAYMSSLTSAGFIATQYALFSSLYALPGKLIASQSGRIVEGAARSAEAGGQIRSASCWDREEISVVGASLKKHTSCKRS